MKEENELGAAGKGGTVYRVVKVESFEYSEVGGAVKQSGEAGNGTSILEGSLDGVDAAGESSLIVKEVKVESLENLQLDGEALTLEDPLDTDKRNRIMNEVQVEEGIEEDNKECRAEASGTEHDVGITCEDNVLEPYDFRNDKGNEAATSVHEHLLSKSTTVKEIEIFVGGLHRKTVEDELIDVFGSFGELQSVRIVKNLSTQKSRGYAFIKYANVENARKVLSELKDGLEIRGKHVSLSASVDNSTLFLENVCKTWMKNQVQETLITLGIDNVVELCLPSDPMNERTNKGFAYLEFDSHSSAMTALQRLRKPDAIFGSVLSAKVSFSQSTLHFTEHALSQVKTVYIDHFPSSWDENKVIDVCKQYGEIEKVWLSWCSPKKRKKHFGLIDFVSRESAIACVDGMNQTPLGEGERKVRASLAKPKKRSQHAKHNSQGGFLVELSGKAREEPTLSKSGLQKSKGEKEKRKDLQHSEAMKDSKPSELHGKDAGKKNSGVSRGKKRKGNNMDIQHSEAVKDSKPSELHGKDAGKKNSGVSRGKKRKGNNMGIQHSEAVKDSKPSVLHGKGAGKKNSGASRGKKRKRNNMNIQHSEAVKDSKPSELHGKGAGKKNSGVSRGKKRKGNNMDSVHGHRTKKACNRHSEKDPGHSTVAYSHSHAEASVCCFSDLEPHAGYLPARKQSSNLYIHAQTRATAYENRPFGNAGYPRGTTGGLRLQSYSAYSIYGAHQGGYSYPGHYVYQRQHY